VSPVAVFNLSRLRHMLPLVAISLWVKVTHKGASYSRHVCSVQRACNKNYKMFSVGSHS